MIKLYVLPEIAVIKTPFRDAPDMKDDLVISIVSPGREHPKIIGKNVYKFHFHDVTEDYIVNSGIINKMTKEIAESIVEIVMENRDCDRWIIHCEAGISRSPGVAIGLARFIRTEPSMDQLIDMFPFHNKHVRRLIEEAMEVRMKELDNI